MTEFPRQSSSVQSRRVAAVARTFREASIYCEADWTTLAERALQAADAEVRGLGDPKVCEMCITRTSEPFYSEEGDAFCASCSVSNLAAQTKAFRDVCEQIDAHYSGSLDPQPAYIQAARRALEEW